ncbi:MAG TPA: 7-cyano-7-deazaguanine synthase [Herpetosiphonaceae bacterium]|nr:7-cyano-7-deazaguanine synthase [Herpetosiphonaceae bacterium]
MRRGRLCQARTEVAMRAAGARVVPAAVQEQDHRAARLAVRASDPAEGTRLNVPFAETWSCYKGGERHCGKCGTCVERIEAFELVGMEDPTEYE